MATKQLQKVLEILEKHLTKAELNKREEVALAIEKDNPGIDVSKKMAIATAVAKRVAEETELSESKPPRKGSLAYEITQQRKKYDNTPERVKEIDRIADKNDFYGNARIVHNRKTNESELSELSRKTLSSYFKKAGPSVNKLGIEAARARDSDDMETWAKKANARDNRDHMRKVAQWKLRKESILAGGSGVGKPISEATLEELNSALEFHFEQFQSSVNEAVVENHFNKIVRFEEILETGILESDLIADHIEQALAHKDINASVQGNKVLVFEPSHVSKAKKELARLGLNHDVVHSKINSVREGLAVSADKKVGVDGRLYPAKRKTLGQSEQ